MAGSSKSPKRTSTSGSPSGTVSSVKRELSLAVSVDADERGIHVTFEDGRVITAPLTERLRAATTEQRRAGYVEGFGTNLHWEEIDEDVGVNWVLGVSEDVLDEFAGFTKGMPAE